MRNLWQLRQDKAKARAARRKDNRRFQAKVAGKKLLPSRKTIRAKLDAITSLFVRMRDKKLYNGRCLVCQAKKRLGFIQDRKPNLIELAYHVQRRGREAVRWSLHNIVGACSACNHWEKLTRYQQPETVRKVHIELVGAERHAQLEEAANAGAKYSTAELRHMFEQRKMLMEQSNGL